MFWLSGHLDKVVAAILSANKRFTSAWASSGCPEDFVCLLTCLVFISSGLPFCLHSPYPPLKTFLLWQNQPLLGAHCLLCFPQIASFHRGCTNSVVLYPIVTGATGTCLHMSPIKGWKCVSSCLCLQPHTCCLLELCFQKRANWSCLHLGAHYGTVWWGMWAAIRLESPLLSL